MVVGNRGRGGFASLLLGSVSQQVATHAITPVVVVRGRDNPSSGPVVVGVDGSPAADAALGLAFEAAALRGCELVAIRVHPTPATAFALGVPPVPYDAEAASAEERVELEECVARWRDKYPRLAVETRTADGSPAQVFVDASRTAQLLVVGSRTHSSLGAIVLGSLGVALLHHADCPVMVAHAPAPA